MATLNTELSSSDYMLKTLAHFVQEITLTSFYNNHVDVSDYLV